MIDILCGLVVLLAWIFDKIFNNGDFFAALNNESSEDKDPNPSKDNQIDDPSERQMKHDKLGLMKVMITKNRGGPNYIKEIWNRKN